MKITIYVRDLHLEALHKFISGGEQEFIEWHHDRPGLGRFLMVTIDYNDFINLI
jgi:hypothetical protein